MHGKYFMKAHLCYIDGVIWVFGFGVAENGRRKDEITLNMAFESYPDEIN